MDSGERNARNGWTMEEGPKDNKAGTHCPSLHLVLEKEKHPSPGVRERAGGGGTGCLLLASPWAHGIWEHWERMEFGW